MTNLNALADRVEEARGGDDATGFALLTKAELAAQFADALSTLASLSSFVGAGMGDDNTTADEYDERIRWGIDHLVAATIQRCADVVEQQSLNPARASFGTIKRAILDLAPPKETQA